MNRRRWSIKCCSLEIVAWKNIVKSQIIKYALHIKRRNVHIYRFWFCTTCECLQLVRCNAHMVQSQQSMYMFLSCSEVCYFCFWFFIHNIRTAQEKNYVVQNVFFCSEYNARLCLQWKWTFFSFISICRYQFISLKYEFMFCLVPKANNLEEFLFSLSLFNFYILVVMRQWNECSVFFLFGIHFEHSNQYWVISTCSMLPVRFDISIFNFSMSFLFSLFAYLICTIEIDLQLHDSYQMIVIWISARFPFSTKEFACVKRGSWTDVLNLRNYHCRWYSR